MKKFVSYNKMSKKQKKEFNGKKRKDWSVFNIWLSGHQMKKNEDKKK